MNNHDVPEPHLASFDYTHVLYDPRSTTSEVLALLTLSPILLFASYAALIVWTREITIIIMLLGQLSNEYLNYFIKQYYRIERPRRKHESSLLVVYGINAASPNSPYLEPASPGLSAKDRNSSDGLLALPPIPALKPGFFSAPFEKFVKDVEMSEWAGALTLLDTLETYWDSRMDLLERRLKIQGEKLKVRANEQLAKIKTPTGDVKYAKDIENEVKKFKVKISTRMASLTTAWQSAKVIRTREKVSFFIGVMSILYTSLVLALAPEWLHVIYTIQTLIFLPTRYYSYKKKAWHYFLFDLCYYVNVLCLLYIWALPGSKLLWHACYLLTHDIIWQGLYWKFVLVDRKAKVESGQRTTSFFWLLNDKRGVIGRVLQSVSPDYRLVSFMAGQLLYTIATELPAVFLLYDSPMASSVFLLVIFAVSVWNGAGFYIEVFGRKFERELEALRKELAESRSAVVSNNASPTSSHNLLPTIPRDDTRVEHEHDIISSGVSVSSNISDFEERNSEDTGSPIIIGGSGRELDMKEGFKLDALEAEESRKDRSSFSTTLHPMHLSPILTQTLAVPWTSKEALDNAVTGLERIAVAVSSEQVGDLLEALLEFPYHLFEVVIAGEHSCATHIHQLISLVVEKRQIPPPLRDAILRRLATSLGSIPPSVELPREAFREIAAVENVITAIKELSECGKKPISKGKRGKRHSRHQSMAEGRDIFDIVGLFRPQDQNEANLVNDQLQTFLAAFRLKDVADYYTGLAILNDGPGPTPSSPEPQAGNVDPVERVEQVVEPVPVAFEDYEINNFQDVVIPDRALLYLGFDCSQYGEWPIKISQRALGYLRQLNTGDAMTLSLVQTKIKELSTGYFSHPNYIELFHEAAGVPIFKTKVNGDLRMIYQIDCGPVSSQGVGPNEKAYESQFIRIYGIFTHTQIDYRFWRSVAIELARRGKEYQRRCKARSTPIRESRVVSPMLFDPLPVEALSERSSQDFQIDEEHFMEKTRRGDHRISVILSGARQKRNRASRRSCLLVQSDVKLKPPTLYSKTTTMLFKMLALEILGERTGRQFRQLFVTQSRTLAKRVESYFRSLLDNARDIMGDGKGVTATTLSSALREIDNDADDDGRLPACFSGLQDQHFPLFLTFDELSRLLEGDCGLRFAPSALSAIPIGLPEDRRKQYHPLISFDVFLSTIWPHFNESRKKGLNAALVFSEIIGIIKGSEDALASASGFLDRKSYEEISSRRHGTFAGDRSRIYDLFESYQKIRHQGSYDAADRTRLLLRSPNDFHDIGKLDYLYVDEVQDNLIIDAALLRKLCRNPHGIFFAGDTAQTISVGSAFRFVELKDFLYAQERKEPLVQARKRPAIDPKFFELSLNYRSHGGIVKAAADLVWMLNRFFPSSIDSLARETAKVDGPKPMFFTNRQDSDGFRRLLTVKETGRIELGAEQAILVRDAAARERLRETVGKVGIVLTLYESKGMEFNDILLYEFFSDSAALPSNWRALCTAAAPESTTPFDEKTHAILQSELKCLYVGLTRARERVWLWDSTDNGSTLEKFMVGRGLVVSHHAENLIPQIAVASSAQEWEKQGKELFSKRNYAEAAYCFGKAGLPWWEEVALAYQDRHGAGVLAKDSPERRESFSSVAVRFVSLADRAELEDDRVLLYINAGECYMEANKHAEAGSAFLAGKKYTEATWHFRLAGRFDDAAEVIRGHGADINPELLEKVKYVIQIIYTKRKQFKEARTLFSSTDEYAEFMKDQGLDEHRIMMFESQEDHEKAADALWQKGDYAEAIHHIQRSKTPHCEANATSCLMDGLRQLFPYGMLSSSSDVAKAKRDKLLSISSTLQLDKEQRQELELFRIINTTARTNATSDQLANLAMYFSRSGNERCALLAFGGWAESSDLPSLPTLSVYGVLSMLGTYLHYVKTLRSIARTPNLVDLKAYHGAFGISPARDIPTASAEGVSPRDELLHSNHLKVFPHSVIFSHLTRRLGNPTTPGSETVQVSRQDVEDAISFQLLSTVNTTVSTLHASFEALPHNTSSMSETEFNTSLGLLLLLISTLDFHTALRPDEESVRRSMQTTWLSRLFLKLYAFTRQQFGIWKAVPFLIPQYEQTLPTLKIWLREHFDRLRPSIGPQFLADILKSAMLSTALDYHSAEEYIRRGQWAEDKDLAREHRLFDGGRLSVKAALSWFNRAHPARHNCGVGFICHAIKRQVRLDVEVFISFIEEVCSQLILNHHFHYRGTYNGMTLPRSWMIRAFAQGRSERANGSMPYQLLPALRDFIGDLCRPMIGGDMQLEGQPLASANFDSKCSAVLQLCRVIALLGYGNPSLQNNVVDILVGLGRSYYWFLPGRQTYFTVRSWQDVWYMLMQSSKQTVQADGGLVAIYQADSYRGRLNLSIDNITFSSIQDLTAQLVGEHIPLLATSLQLDSLKPEAETTEVEGGEIDPGNHTETEEAEVDALDHIEWTPEEEASAPIIQKYFRRYRKRSGPKFGGPIHGALCELAVTLSADGAHVERQQKYLVLLRGPLLHVIEELRRIRDICQQTIGEENKKMARMDHTALDVAYETGKNVRYAALRSLGSESTHTDSSPRKLKDDIETLLNNLGPSADVHKLCSVTQLKGQVEAVPDLLRRLEEFVPDAAKSTDYFDLGVTPIMRADLPRPLRVTKKKDKRPVLNTDDVYDTVVGNLADDNLELYVQTKAFDEECVAYSRVISKCSSLSDNSDSDSSDNSLWEKDDDSSSVSSVESSPHDVPKLEAHLYYAGLSGPSARGPKLIFRKDKFIPPDGPEAYRRLMKLRPVYEHHKLGENDLWETISSEVVKLLDQRDIRHSSIDLVRFSWVEKNEDNEDNEDFEDIKAVEDGTVVITPITIWVGVLPDTLTGEVAFYSANDILGLLKQHGITDVEVAYRELFAPVSDLDPLKAVVDPLTIALGLPIAGLKTLEMQGTMGFYFRVGKELYAVTARHVLFQKDHSNDEYIYKAGPKKKVVIMGTRTFANFLASIQGHIDILNNTVGLLERRVTTLTARSQGGGPNAQQAASELEETQRELGKTRTAIDELKKCFVKVKKQWTKAKDRVIGHVVWAPPISVATAPHSYTKDVCVVKLDKKKFLQNFMGNVLGLGPEIDAAKFLGLMYPRIGPPFNFEHPSERLLKLRAFLSKEEIRKPTNRNHKGDPMRYVIKRGLTTPTTIGCLSGFESRVRRYFMTGKRDSVEAAIHPYDNDSGPFSMDGDSGSTIVDALGRSVALLTSGTGKTGPSDIAFGTPMHWLWEVIKAQFPGANLYFDEEDD
ncbi:hypothetical protein FRB99_000675 [Tulasnella sp. 403]|nr:hypothetical protein FRB99_000675 [Tulasnella sp. 403]